LAGVARCNELAILTAYDDALTMHRTKSRIWRKPQLLYKTQEWIPHYAGKFHHPPYFQPL